MNPDLKRNKQILRSFMQAQYSDERLAMLLDHARAGKLAYNSCCCFIAIPTANHELKQHLYIEQEIAGTENVDCGAREAHYLRAESLPGAAEAEEAYRVLAGDVSVAYRNVALSKAHDVRRRKIIIPMILAELRRRSRPLPELPSADMLEVWASKSEHFVND